MNDLIGKKFPVLNDGFVTLVDYMGSDTAIVEAARVSFGKGTRKVSEDRDLLRFLMRHKHSTPFEMAEIKVHIRIPMDAWRQGVRHRTASTNEYSTRYSEAIDARQETDPEEWREQSTSNKQGSGGMIGRFDDFPHGLEDLRPENCVGVGEYLSGRERELHIFATEIYEERLKFGVAREQARKDLPLSTYTELFWKCDLRNVLNFLSLRMDSHAQLEIRSYANIIGYEIVAKLFPQTWEAFEDYALGAVTLSALDMKASVHITSGENAEYTLEAIFSNVRERQECRDKLVRLGIL